MRKPNPLPKPPYYPCGYFPGNGDNLLAKFVPSRYAACPYIYNGQECYRVTLRTLCTQALATAREYKWILVLGVYDSDDTCLQLWRELSEESWNELSQIYELLNDSESFAALESFGFK